MKSLKTTALLLFALIMSASVHAGDNKSENKTASKAESGTVLYWFTPTGTPSYLYANTVADEETRTGCSEGAATSERGYLSSQLVNPNNPSQGVKANQTPAATLQISE